MKIILAHNFYQQAGGEDVVFNLEKELLKNNHHEIYEYTEDNQRIGELNRFSLLTQTIWSNPSREKLRRQLQTFQPDIVHFHNTFPLISPAAYAACREMNIPVVQTLHNFRLLCPSALFLRNGKVCEDCLGKTPPWPAVQHACYRHSRTQTAVVAAMLTTHRLLKTWQQQVDLYIVLTQFSRQKFIEGGLPPGKIVVKPNFITPDPQPGNCAGFQNPGTFSKSSDQ